MSQQLSIKSANALFLANELQPKKEFENYAVTQYFSKVDNISVQDSISATNKINDWVNKKTEGLIPTVISPGKYHELIINI